MGEIISAFAHVQEFGGGCREERRAGMALELLLKIVTIPYGSRSQFFTCLSRFRQTNGEQSPPRMD